MTIAAGRLRHRITIEKPTQVQDPVTGDLTEGWEEVVANLPAAIEPLSARDFIQSAAMQSEITTRITIRYRTGIVPDMRVLAAGRVYKIRGVLPDPVSGREHLTLPCREETGSD